MDYKFALKLLSIDGPSGSFNARGLSDTLLAALRDRASIEDSSLLSRMFSTKRISGDLDRLYRMGFLKRKRIKRIVNRINSPSIARGFTYVYTISKQGWQYLQYMSNPKLNEQVDPSEWLLRDIADHMHKTYPEWIANFMEKDLFKSHHEDSGRYNRFPSKTNTELSEALAQCRRSLARKEREIESLRKSNNSRT